MDELDVAIKDAILKYKRDKAGEKKPYITDLERFRYLGLNINIIASAYQNATKIDTMTHLIMINTKDNEANILTDSEGYKWVSLTGILRAGGYDQFSQKLTSAPPDY